MLTQVPVEELEGGEQLLQTGFWGRFKSSAGWVPRAFQWTSGDETENSNGRVLVLERRFPGGLKMAYVPYGPELPVSDPRDIAVFLQSLAGELKSHLSRGCFVIRFDLCGGNYGPVGTEVPSPVSLPSPLKRAPYRVQPPDTVILPLIDSESRALSEEELLTGMHKKTRYNIRLAAKKGVIIQCFKGNVALDKLPDWYRIYRETGDRDGISLHPESYYHRLFELADSSGTHSPDLSLYMASHEDDDLAGIIVSRCGRRSVYMYGASSSQKRELMPNHLLQWTAINDALKADAGEYDFFGIPPADDPSHPMHGLWRFKTGFGGYLYHYRGAWDYPYSQFFYSLYAGAERLRGYLAALRKKR